jgi:hypothetical protein
LRFFLQEPALSESEGWDAMLPEAKASGKRNGMDATTNNPLPRMCARPLAQSSRSNIIGLTDRARRAGIHVATSPSSAIARTTPANTSGS